MRTPFTFVLLVSGWIAFTPSSPVFGESGVQSWVDNVLTPEKKHRHRRHVAEKTDSEDEDATPSPSPVAKHPKHHRVSPDADAPDPDASATPEPEAGAQEKRKKRPHAPAKQDAADEEASPSPTPAAKNDKHVRPDSDAEASDPAPSPTPETARSTPKPGINASIATSEIRAFSAQSSRVQKLIESSLELARQNISYVYGSSDPAGGLDCSGFIYYILRQNGFPDVPRDASEQYIWARKAGTFRAVISNNQESFELDELRPGDLLFWVGTYATQHDPPISHTMIYLGKETVGGVRVMVGSSDGRTYHGIKRNGVSVFDFTTSHSSHTPAKGGAGNESAEKPSARFIGYARIPGI